MAATEIAAAKDTVTLEHADFTGAVSAIAPLVGGNHSLPVFGYLKLSRDAGGMTLACNNLEIAARMTGIGEGGPQIDMLLPADVLKAAAPLLPPEPVTLTREGDGMVILTAGKVRYRLCSLPVGEAPTWPDDPGPELYGCLFRLGALNHLLSNVLYAVPKRDHRRVLMGVNFAVGEGEDTMTMAGSDGKIAARIRVPMGEHTRPGTNTTIPGTFLTAAQRLLADEPDDAEVAMSFGEKQVTVACGAFRVTTFILEGKFPDMAAIIPKDFKHIIDVPRLDLIAAVRRAGIVSDERLHSVIFQFDAQQLAVTASQADVGSHESIIDVLDGAPRKPLELCFNANLMRETLALAEGDRVTLRGNGDNSPWLVAGNKDTLDIDRVIMPIKLGEERFHEANSQEANKA